MRTKISSKNVEEDSGIVYVLLIHLEDKDLVKIGISGRDKIEDRVIEILLGIYKRYRYFPYCYTKRFRKTTGKTEKEQMLHEYFKKYSYSTQHSFGGHTEMFDIPLDAAVEAYERVLAGENLGKEVYEKEDRCEENPDAMGEDG